MTIIRYPLLIIALFTIIGLTACTPPNNTRWDTPAPQKAPVITGTNAQNTAPNPNRNFDNLPPVNVAILLPLSGAQSALGESMLQAAQLALFEMGYSGFNLMPRDTQGTPNGASAAATAAINDGAQLILGPIFANSVRAVKTVAQPRNINVIAFSTDWTLADRSTFLMGFMPFSQVDRVSAYANAQGYQNFALIAPRDKYGDLVSNQFEKRVTQNRGIISKNIRFVPGDPGVVNQIETLKDPNAQFQAVFMPVGGSQIETISSALSYNKFMPSQIKRLGTGLWDDPRIANQPNMQGAWFAAPSPNARRAFEQKYESTYGIRPIRIATLAYDATALAATLARNGFERGTRPAFDYRSITNSNGFSGTDGVFRFQPNGLVERQLAILELRRGQIVEIDPASTRF